MKLNTKTILFVLCFSMQGLVACPFYFNNDGQRSVVLVDRSSDLMLSIPAGVISQIPGDVAPNIVWIYVSGDVANVYNARYGITEHECVEEGNPLPIVQFSTLENRANMANIVQGLQIIIYNAAQFMDVPATITYFEKA